MKRKGKVICQHLKELRRNIATENGIPLEIPTASGHWTIGEKCHYKGECSGTCPRCEAEMRYLEEQLSQRISLGKIATVAGLALGLATGTQAQQDTPKNPVAEKDTSVIKIEKPPFSLTDNDIKEHNSTWSCDMDFKIVMQKSETGEEKPVIVKSSVQQEMRSPWETIQYFENYFMGSVGYQDGGRDVKAERHGPLLIVVEPEEPEL